ncbi:MAG TPA: AAA family ATPase, partial [Patescibacteria group bacterium]|nr:AAA family ATPase [Patescibacteria group bacterium]
METLIKTLLYEWKERQLPEVIPRENNLEGYLDQKIPKITAITGFRRTGKTYLVFELIKKLLNEKNREQVVYINFEDERIPAQKEFLSKLLPTAEQILEEKVEYLFLDEIQNIPEWSKWLRRIYDQTDIKIFVTGSSSKLSSREIPTELRGRCLEEKVFPLSFREFL